jgi:dTDP-4-dehydrorhamnose 3,5-epimerase-like enzyme
MKRFNIVESKQKDLEAFSDARGKIMDLFYEKNINHVAWINSVEGAIRGNHYHKKTTQHTLLMSGTMHYHWTSLSGNEKGIEILKAGDLITSGPNEIHTMVFPEFSTMLVFSEGPRGGKDYEKDTFRVPSILR